MSYKHKFYLHVTIIILVLGGLAYGGWFLFGLVSQTAEGKIQELQKDLSLVDAQIKRANEIFEEYESAKESIPILDASLLDWEDRLKFIILVEQLVKQTGVSHEIEAVESEREQKVKSGENEILFNVNITGSFPQVLSFVYLLENSRYYLNIDRLRLTRLIGAGSQSTQQLLGEIKAQMLIKIYSVQD